MVSFLPFASSRTFLHLFPLLSLASLAQSQGTSSLRQGVNTVTQKEQRITGGDHVTSIFTYPYFAHTSPFSCGGVLISKRFILTAAHCVDGSMQHFRIGGLSKTDGILVEAYLFGVHPLWGNNLNSMAYDIAIYEVLDEISDIPHYPKLQKLHLTEPGIPLEVIGLGDTDYYTTSPSVSLRKGTVKYISNRDCKLEYTNVETDRITVSEMCAIGTEGQDSCFGDSGGPLLDRNHFGDDLLVGLVSWGRGCGDSRYPGVYARISTSYDWIVLAMCNAVSEREYFGFSNNPKDIPYYIDCNRDKISDDFFQYDDDFMYFGYHDDDYYFLDLDDDDFDYDLFDDDCYDLFDNDPPQQRTCQPKGEVCESNNDCCQSLECNPFHKYCYSTIDADKFSDRGSVAGGAGGAAAKATAIP